MATTTTSPAPTENNSPEALLQEQRAGVIGEIESYLKFVIEDDTPLADLMILKDVLCIAHSNAGSILTGIGATLNRKRSDAVFVRMEHREHVSSFAQYLEDADDAMTARKRTTADVGSAYRVRKDILGWLAGWSDIRLGEWWQLGHAVAKHVSGAVTPVESAIVEMGGSYWLSMGGERECTLDTLQADLDKARKLSQSLYEEESDEDESEVEEKSERSSCRADLQKWLDTWTYLGLEYLWQIGHAIKNNRGNAITPVEDWVRHLGLAYWMKDEKGQGLTFDWIQGSLDEAKRDFDDAVAAARYINERYPEALTESEVETHA